MFRGVALAAFDVLLPVFQNCRKVFHSPIGRRLHVRHQALFQHRAAISPGTACKAETTVDSPFFMGRDENHMAGVIGPVVVALK